MRILRIPLFVYKLQKSLYGLKYAPRVWFDKLHQALIHLGFTSAKSDQSLFLKSTKAHTILVLVYVDDILITGSDSTMIGELITQLDNKFALKDLGNLDYFLGIQVKRTKKGLHLS